MAHVLLESSTLLLTEKPSLGSFNGEVLLHTDNGVGKGLDEPFVLVPLSAKNVCFNQILIEAVTLSAHGVLACSAVCWDQSVQNVRPSKKFLHLAESATPKVGLTRDF